MTSTNTDSILAELFGSEEPFYNPSSQPSSPVVKSEEFDQTRKRTFSLLNRETISSIVADSDDESYDVESSDERLPKRAKNAKKYGGYKRKGDKGLFVGHHIDDSNLPVYVRYYPNGALNARVYHEDVSEELQTPWAALFKQRGSLTLDKIEFDGELFKDDAVNIQGLSVALKRERLIQYLTGNGVPKRNSSAAAGDIASAEKQLGNTVQNSSPAIPDEEAQEDVSSGTADISLDIHIGFWIEHPKARVYAFTKTFTYPDRTDLRICYRAHRKDADGPVFEDDEKAHRFWRYGGMIKQENIKFSDEFVKGTIEETKAYIKSLFNFKLEKGTIVEVSTPTEGPRRASTRLSDREPVARSGSGGLRGTFQQAENMNSSPMIYPKKSAMRGTIKQEQSPSGAAKRRGASRTSRGVPVNDQEVTIRRQDEELIRLREQVRQLEQKNRKLSQKTVDLESNEQPLGLASKMFGGKRFDLQESGDNTGKYLQRVFEKVHCGGKYYEEWVVLEELKLSLKGWGSREGPTVQIGGIDFYKVKDGDHKGKFVQKVGPDSLCEFDGQKYIKWTIREQISDKSLRLNI